MKYPKSDTSELTQNRNKRGRERENEKEGGEEDYSSEKDTAGRINKDSRNLFLLSSVVVFVPRKYFFY